MPNVITHPTAFSVDEYRRALGEMIANIKPTHFITLVFNRDMEMTSAEKALRAFHARLDRKALGPGWRELGGKRSRYIAIAENVDTNFHFHAAFVVAPGYEDAYANAALKAWEKLMPRGSVDVQPVSFSEGIGRYATKQITPNTSDRLIISEGFA